MTANLLITGRPRSGKTTVIKRVWDRTEAHGYRAGGVYCPERRVDGARVGFDIVDIMTGETRLLAHVDREEGPQVGKYRIDVPAVDAVCSAAFPRARNSADFLIVDEIAPMEVHSAEFVRQVRRALDAALPVVAAVHQRSTAGFIGEIKDRDDITLFEVTPETRDGLPATLATRLCREL